MIEIQTGYCVCCGSPQIVQVSGSQRDADMMATAKCGCDGAIQARMMARVHQAVDEVTSSGAELDGYGEVHPDVVRLMEDVAQAVAKGHVAGAQLSLVDGSRVVIRTGKDGLEVRRERKNARTGSETAMTDGEMAELLGAMVPLRQKSDTEAV